MTKTELLALAERLDSTGAGDNMRAAVVLRAFAITGPDADGLVWLVLHGNGTSGKALFNLGRRERISTQVALALEQDRRAAIAEYDAAQKAAPELTDEEIAAIFNAHTFWNGSHRMLNDKEIARDIIAADRKNRGEA